MKIKVNTDVFQGYAKGQIVNVPDKNGVPDERFWRRRLRDSAIDGCCEIVVDEMDVETIEEGE